MNNIAFPNEVTKLSIINSNNDLNISGFVSICICSISTAINGLLYGIKSPTDVYNIIIDGSDIVNNIPINNVMNNNLIRLQSFLQLDYNWNGNGADKISSDLVNQMKYIVSYLSIQPSIFPTARHSIQFVYEKENDDYLQFELFEDGRLKQFTMLNNGDHSTEYIDFDIDHINRTVKIFNG